MDRLEYPKLRPLQAVRVLHEGIPHVRFSDPTGLASSGLMVPEVTFRHVVSLFDGTLSRSEIQARILRETGQLVTQEQLDEIVRLLDQHLILEGPAYQKLVEGYAAEGVRPPALAGRSYPAGERALRAQLGSYFVERAVDGSPIAGLASGGLEEGLAGGKLRGVISPHIDFQRGGHTYARSYRTILEHSSAEVFVILGVSHQPCRNRFVLTYKDFETPLGRARTDRTYVERLAAVAGSHLFDDEIAHRLEHSIEFQVVFLQYILGEKRDYTIVPILVGSFHDLLVRGVDPIQHPEVRKFIDAMNAAESSCGKPVLYIGGIDLGHIGSDFGDYGLLEDARLEQLRDNDTAMLNHAAMGDAAAWFSLAAAAGNRWRICGLAATYTMLHAMGPTRGTLLHYDQATNTERTCCVSFASLAFERVASDHDTAA